jgi:NAD(P)-dependent dehydrogenase (short-subunit alcohol dehydrogenase family)
MNYLEKLFNLKDKVAVITGAKGQLGTKLCEAFKNCGAKVIGLDVGGGGDRNLIEDVDYMDLDIRQKKEVVNIFRKIIEKYKRFDILINNAGVSTFEPFEERPEESIDRVMDINLKGTFFCLQAYVKLFDEAKFKNGSIINIASLYGLVSPDYRIYTDCPRKNSEMYGATKAGIIQMTKYFAVHLAERQIRVNAISPGGIYNPDNPQGDDFIKNYSFRCPMKRMAEDEEMLGAAIYLSSEAASYTTGQNIAVDGGFSSW